MYLPLSKFESITCYSTVTVAFGQGRTRFTDATAARFSTPTASPPAKIRRRIEFPVQYGKATGRSSHGYHMIFGPDAGDRFADEFRLMGALMDVVSEYK